MTFARWAFVLGIATVCGPCSPASSRCADDARWGTVKGQAVWGGGDVPAPKPIAAINNHQDKATCQAKGPVFSEEWVINPANKGVRWVFVWLAPADESQKLPVHPSLQEPKEKEVVIDQPCCAFVPHAVALRTGQELVVKNSAPISHNVNWAGGIKNPGSNVIIAAKGEPVRIKNLVPDRFPVKLACNIHPWMSAWVRVFDHPYVAVTDADGKFEIKQAPAGKYRLVVWQEGMGFLGGAAGRNGQPIEIKKDAPTDVGKLELKP